jgi:hypothetical protein
MSKHWLARDITVVIVLKVVIIFAASFFVFGAKQRPVVDERAMQERLIAAEPVPGTERGF